MNNMTEMKETMSSLEIAKLTGKRHDNVLRKCRELIEKGIILATQSEERDIRGKLYPVFNLNKIESLNLVANLSPEFTSIIIDRWQELEKAQPQMTQLEILVEASQNLLRIENQQKEIINQQAKQASEIAELKERQNRMDGDTQYMTVLAFLRSIKEDAPKSTANALGRKCSGYCKKRGHPIGSVPDERWGSVNSYPLFVLEGYWSKRK